MSTYGDIRLRLTKAHPGIDQDLLDGWIMDRYQAILDRLPWKRLETNFTFDTATQINTGTVTVALGSAAVFGAGTAWSVVQNGWTFRVGGDDGYYTFTCISPTQGTLDRPYEGNAVYGDTTPSPNAGQGYQLAQNVYPLPSGLRFITSVRNLDTGRELTKLGQGELNWASASRVTYGTPESYSLYMDETAGTVPVQQIELYPIPQQASGIGILGIAEDLNFSSASTSVSALPWIRPSAINAGVDADVLGYEKNYVGAQYHERRYEMYVEDMVRAESSRIGSTKLHVAQHLINHRLQRVLRGGPPYRRLP